MPVLTRDQTFQLIFIFNFVFKFDFFSKWLLHQWASGNTNGTINDQCTIIAICKPESSGYTITEYFTTIE